MRWNKLNPFKRGVLKKGEGDSIIQLLMAERVIDELISQYLDCWWITDHKRELQDAETEKNITKIKKMQEKLSTEKAEVCCKIKNKLNKNFLNKYEIEKYLLKKIDFYFK